ncbi:SURF1-like protein [Aeromicrobium flavum]|uniref:SURF1-like protein n=1 Tax=Aeromicrobium flavum TaxID=416568 RepID=A0A512HU51_9ACTN|nr:SURF1 family protein [Aeromicrobium flavum]GEO88977.1 SURF1-like protein [Aeromicrobium flavum]
MTDRPGPSAWFAPRLLGLHLFAIAAVVFCVFMASWQLGVYDQRQADERAEQLAAGPADLESVWGPGQVFTTDQDQRPVTVTGRFRPAAEQLWVTDREQGGETGAWLLAPVTVDDAELMVVRGWAPRPAASLPDVPGGLVTFDAVLQPGDESGAGWDPDARTIGSVRIPTLLNELGYDDLWSGYAIATDGEVAGGLEVAEVPETDVSWLAGGQNLGYGLQWWVFAGFVIFMWWRMSREMVLGRER